MTIGGVNGSQPQFHDSKIRQRKFHRYASPAPVYMIPCRNCYGIIGPVRRSEMTPEAISAKVNAAGKKFDVSKGVAYSVLTNCTYDGLCYNGVKTESELHKEPEEA